MSAPGRARAPEFSISLQNRGVLARPDTIVPIAERAEALGYDALWTADHVVMPMRCASKYPYSVTGEIVLEPTGDYLEPLAANPLVTAKMLATLDVSEMHVSEMHETLDRFATEVRASW